MQNQLNRNATQSVNQTQSLAAVQTLLRAGLGTITYLRNLLPEDNFTRSHFTYVDDSGAQCDASQESTSSRTNVSGFRITTITRGYTDEADKILNYMEYGIFDALEKRYLRSFIFGIYLDAKDPTNIVEAYTFNFKYHIIPGSDVFIPVMSLQEAQKKKAVEDAVTKAIKQGKPPTLKDVKMSVKALLKTLIQAISSMDVLPRRRFATFKLFYTEETPPDYEPPHFESGDAEKDKWFFMTHDLDEVPERSGIGKINTGYHSVNLNVTSIASYLPSSSEHTDDAPFSGLTANRVKMNFTPLEEAALCKTQAEKQLQDAKNRNLVWPVEDVVELSDLDAEGEDDPEYVKLPDGRFERVEDILPIGIRNESGTIEAIHPQEEMEEMEEAHYGGMSENVPRYLREMATEKALPGHSHFEETQLLIPTPKQPERASTPTSVSTPNHRSTLIPLSTAPTSPTCGDFDPEMLKSMCINTSDHCDSEMLDVETQMPYQDVVHSYGQVQVHANLGPPNPETSIKDKGLQCDCRIDVEDEACYCEGGCQKWFHLWCMGYHTINDPRIPSKFICFDCRLRRDVHWELIKVDLYPQMISKYNDITLFRRAIKVAETLQSFSSLQFSKEFGGDAASAGQTLKTLEERDFVFQESIALDDMGIAMATRSKKGKNAKGAALRSKGRKNLQKSRYAFNQEIRAKSCYLDYFKPDEQEVETSLLGISDMVKPLHPKPTTFIEQMDDISIHSQTQNETQEMTELELPVKRNITEAQETGRPSKKLKMSVAMGVDLAE